MDQLTLLTKILSIVVALLTQVQANTADIVALKSHTPNFGAVSGPDSYNPCESHNGVTTCFNKKGFTSATTTVCAIKSPSATSTLKLGSGARFTVGSTTASTVTFAKAVDPYSTTTSIGSAQLGANTQATILATTTASQNVDPVHVFAPNTYFVVGMAGGIGTFSPTGTCQAVFELI